MKKCFSMIFILLVAGLLLSACSSTPALPQAATVVGQSGSTSIPATAYPVPSNNPAPVAQDAYPAPAGGVQVKAADGNSKQVTLSAVTGIAKVKVSVNGKEQQLRKLSDFFSLAGIASNKSATVAGKNGQMVLTGEQLGKAYLDIAADGSLMLVVDGVQPDKWISGVTQIDAK